MMIQPSASAAPYQSASLRTKGVTDLGASQEANFEQRKQSAELDHERSSEQRHHGSSLAEAAVHAAQIRARVDQAGNHQRAATDQRPAGAERDRTAPTRTQKQADPAASQKRADEADPERIRQARAGRQIIRTPRV